MVWQRRDRGLDIAGAVAEFVPADWLLTLCLSCGRWFFFNGLLEATDGHPLLEELSEETGGPRSRKSAKVRDVGPWNSGPIKKNVPK